MPVLPLVHLAVALQNAGWLPRPAPREPRVREHGDPALTLRVVGVEYADPSAAALRSMMDAEARYRTPGHAAVRRRERGGALYTGLAVTGDGRPIGHVALRRAGDDVELTRMYVIPAHRDDGVVLALLRAAEDAAAALGVRRIILRAGAAAPYEERRHATAER